MTGLRTLGLIFLGAALAAFYSMCSQAFAHPHPPPVTCGERCLDKQCKCYDACAKLGHPEGCTDKCNDQRDQCNQRCEEQPI